MASSHSDASAETRPSDGFRCVDCGKVCKNKAGLTLHRKVHKSVVPSGAAELSGNDHVRVGMGSGTLSVADVEGPSGLPPDRIAGVTASMLGACEGVGAGSEEEGALHTPVAASSPPPLLSL